VLRGRDDLRPVAPDSLHVTLAFLGHRPVEEIEAITAATDQAIRDLGPARLEPQAVTGVPRRRPRLFALDLADPDDAGAAVHAAVSDALSSAGVYEPEKRKFWPHVTVARVARAERKAAPITVPPPSDGFTATEVVLYRSQLGRGPARYEALARFTL
jgi:2'-5' RNA ligase